MDLNQNSYWKDRTLRIRLLQPEEEVLASKAKEAKMSRAKFLRNAIHYGGAYQRTKFIHADWSRVINALCSIGNSMNQIKFLLCWSEIDEHSFLSLYDNYMALLSDFNDFL